MASEDVQTNLRLPADLKDRLVASAAQNNRSLSAEVSSRLEASYAFDRAPRAAELEVALKATQDATQFVLLESTMQIAALARSNEAARHIAAELLEDLETTCQIAQELLEGELKDRRSARVEVDRIRDDLPAIELQLSESSLPSLRKLSEAIREKADELEQKLQEQG